MELTKENLQEWKELLRKQMLEQYDMDNYDETRSDEDWLLYNAGDTPQVVINNEVGYW